MTADRVIQGATCLGCGCTCDDIDVAVRDGRIVEAHRACSLGAAWFGDGRAPARALVSGRDASVDEALAAAARLLIAASRPVVYLAPELTCEAQREAAALGDVLRASLDSISSDTVLPAVLAAQEQGTAAATLGEVRNRADLLVFWGVDPSARYPRYWSRYAPEPAGVHVPDGRASRTVVAVDIGRARGPADVDQRYALSPEDELTVLAWLRGFATRDAEWAPVKTPEGSLEARAGALAETLCAARYAVLVADAEPDPLEPARDPYRAEALIALAQALHARTRAALSTLRAGGNRTGADAVLTWQTGYPLAIDFARAAPRYQPYDGTASARLGRREADAVLLVGAAAALPGELAARLARVPVAAIGPAATSGPLARSDVAIDTGVAGIHEAGMAVRMDDVPLPVRVLLEGPPAAAAIVRTLRERIVAMRRQGE